jgi:alpha-glucosidase
MPLSRTLAIDYTQDENVYDLRFQNQFLFGDSILVVPVESTKFYEDVYLPKGDWYRLSTVEKFEGGKVVTAPAPLTDLPVFIKAGAIIPMQNVIQSTNEKGDGILEINVWYGKETTSFVYYEDDGTSYNYQQGIYYKREISFDPAKGIISLFEVEGSFLSKYDQIKLMLHGFGETTVKVNGEVLILANGETTFNNDTKTIAIEY